MGMVPALRNPDQGLWPYGITQRKRAVLCLLELYWFVRAGTLELWMCSLLCSASIPWYQSHCTALGHVVSEGGVTETEPASQR